MSHGSELDRRTEPVTQVDYAALFGSLPTAYLVMTPDLVIVDANPAYVRLTGRPREDIVGRVVFDAFTLRPDSRDVPGQEQAVRLSLERARDSGRVDPMPLARYEFDDPSTGRTAIRYMSLVSAPVHDAQGDTSLLLQRVEDVTTWIEERRQGRDEPDGLEHRRRVEVTEAELHARALELRAALAAEAKATRQLASMAEAALQLAGAETVEQLIDVTAGAGLSALSATGGAIAVVSADGSIRLTVFGGDQRTFSGLRPDSDAPAAWVIRNGRPMLLPDRACDEALWEQVTDVYQDTGCLSWAIVPLQVGERIIGSLSAGWSEELAVASDPVEMVTVLAAQCAQTLDRLQVRAAEQLESAANRTISETLQRSLLTEPPQLERFALAVRYQPANLGAHVGGDWYDAFRATPDITTLVIGDVTGHDLTAAAAMGQIRNVLRGVAHWAQGSPATVLAALDRTLGSLQVDTLATAALAQVRLHEAGEAVFAWSSAGHLPPLLLTPEGTATLLVSDADLLLGLDPDTDRSDQRVTMMAGATILLYTDGLVERRGESLDVGLERLRTTAADLVDLPIEGFCDALLARMADRHLDDIALLAVRLEGTGP
ncbi:hypothetical protein acdb102_37310 [Acidothermaceae bacterium B102]|nr:hypothetical protein acdb102_37310 [Acidothermaceae bacterium B102]